MQCKNKAASHVGVDDLGNITVWYNYIAATAGAVIGSNYHLEATEDICPAGWKTPSDSEFLDSVINYPSLFSPVHGGEFGDDGFHWQNSNGVWWTSTQHSDGGSRRLLVYRYDSPCSSYGGRDHAYYIRCMFKG